MSLLCKDTLSVPKMYMHQPGYKEMEVNKMYFIMIVDMEVLGVAPVPRWSSH